ncbi:hypothetical protein [Pengzhenrongella frigida]|uniref:Uncharacterized protein n=1 Tax=Pengzhenrongella frigida TaxID=1259133 RepID=A0A4Q5MXF7_9MICO|nr:hypothetical protein [Cellulomonas sp. HLT2-17]RYV50319.1 hypothetical protein EUA98_14000 [Cellulomonas sp. HLT2-17]
MIIDCGRCAVRGAACADCVVTFLTIEVREPIEVDRDCVVVDLDAAVAGLDGAAVDLDGAEQAALEVLASSGLVPPLRLAILGQTG